MDGQRPGQTQEDDPDDLAVPAAGGGRDRAAAAEELPRVTDAPSSLVFILDLFLTVFHFDICDICLDQTQ